MLIGFNSDHQGACNWSGRGRAPCSFGRDDYALLSVIGINAVRIDVNRELVEPVTGGPLNLAALEYEIDAAKAGQMSVFLQLHDKRGRAEMATYGQWCAQIADLYGHLVAGWEVWNEPEYDGMLTQDAGSADAFLAGVVIPAADGIRTACPEALILGPTVDNQWALVACLDAEALLRREVYGALSWHSYPWGAEYPAGALARCAEFMDAAKPYRAGRPIYVSETGDDNKEGRLGPKADVVSFINAACDLGVEGVFIYRGRSEADFQYGFFRARESEGWVVTPIIENINAIRSAFGPRRGRAIAR